VELFSLKRDKYEQGLFYKKIFLLNMKKPVEARGDKFRKFLFAVWLANKYEKNISTVNLGKIAGFKGPGGPQAIKESRWVKEDINLGISLTKKGESYLKDNILYIHKAIRQILQSFLVFILLMIIQRYMYDSFGIILIGNFWFLVLSALIIIVIHVFWYRLLWIISKNRAGK